MNVLLSGSHGLVGMALMESLAPKYVFKQLGRNFSEVINFEGVDVLIHLAGESIAEGKWKTAKKRRIRDSRIISTQQISKQLSETRFKPKVFICASAIGYYGSCGDKRITEKEANGSGFLAGVCREWETATQEARDAGIRTVNLRTGIVLSKKGGALKKMLFPFRVGAGGILGSGKQFMSWISIHDVVGAVEHIIDTDSLSGPVNLTAPNPVTNFEFTKTLGRVLKRPTIFPLPTPAVRLIFGEMGEELLLSSANVFPEKLENSGYIFKHRHLEDALKDILK